MIEKIIIISCSLVLFLIIVISEYKRNKFKKELNASKNYVWRLEKINDELSERLQNKDLQNKDQYILSEKVSEIELENIWLKLEIKDKAKKINRLKSNLYYYKNK